MGTTSAGPVDRGPTFIRTGTVADAVVAGRLHAEQITTGFLSFLGHRFLYRLYRRVVLWDGGLLLVVVDPSKGPADSPDAVVGFIASADPTAALYRTFLLHDSIPAALGAAESFACSWRRVAENTPSWLV